MIITIYAAKHTPNCIETIKLDNVASYEVDDNKVVVKFNGEPDQTFMLINTETEKNGCWFSLTIVSEKIGLKVKI